MKTNYVGRLAKEARLKANMSQADVAVKLGYTTSQYVSNWERGLAPFSPKIAKRFCQITKCNIHEMFKALVAEQREKTKEALFNKGKR